MAVTVDGLIGAGFNKIYVFAKNAAGAIVGSDTTEPTAGSSTGTTGIRVEGAQTINVAIPDGELVDVLGDDEPQVQFDFGSATLPNGIIELSTRNLYLEAAVQGTSVYSPDGSNEILAGVLMPKDEDLQDIAILMGRQAKEWKPGSRGIEKWELRFIPSCTARPLDTADWTQRAHGPYRYAISVSKGDLMPWGETFYDGALSTAAAAIMPLKTSKMYISDIFKGDGVNATFTLTRIPVTTVAAVVTVAGVIVSSANYTISASPNLITFTGGNEPALNSLTQVWYPVEKNNL